MSDYEMFMLLWLLPSLVTVLLYISTERLDIGVYKEKNPEDYTKSDWYFLLAFSIIYPLGIVFMISFMLDNYGDFLVKEIKFDD